MDTARLPHALPDRARGASSLDRETARALLTEARDRCGRLPRKGDFPPETVQAVKALYGPWRYALEDAGLIDSRQDARVQANREKRARARKARKQAASPDRSDV